MPLFGSAIISLCAGAIDCPAKTTGRGSRSTSTHVPGEEEWAPRYNIAPTRPVPVIRQHPKGKCRVAT
jgi:putative SOS response-associated peptidase YedK